jgi:hypothetical protein
MGEVAFVYDVNVGVPGRERTWTEREKSGRRRATGLPKRKTVIQSALGALASHSLLCLHKRCGGRHLPVDATNAGFKDGIGYTCPLLAKGFGQAVSEYKAIAPGLGSVGMLDAAEVKLLQEMAGYRNLLVHVY